MKREYSRKNIRASFPAATFLMLTFVLFIPAQSRALVRPPDGKRVPDYDIRLLDRRAAPAGIPTSFASDLTRQGFLWSLNPSTGALKSVMSGRQSLTPAQAGDPVDIALAFIASHEDWLGLPPGGTRDLALESSFTTAHNGMRHVWFIQEHEGVDVFNGRIGVHLDKLGRIFAVSADEVASFFEPRVQGEIDATTALRIAAASIGEPLEGGETPAPVSPAATRIVRFERGNFGAPPEAQMVYFNRGGQARAAWSVSVDPQSESAAYLIIVDAAGGEVLLRKNRMLYAQGLVYPKDPESTPNRVKVDFGVKPESPLGWVDASANLTTGNNVHAYHDPGQNFFIFCMDGTPEEIDAPPSFQDFSYPIDLSQDPSAYKGAAIANLFYLNNFMHDYLYRLGFDEASGNYQVDNFGLGGAEGDLVEAQAQDGWPDCANTLFPNTNNANFTPGPDGTAGKMQMYIWTMTDPVRDGDLDSDVVMHEYCHGLSSRLVGGPSAGGAGLANAQGGAMGEAWSDFFAGSINDDDVMGEYSYGSPGGIRTYPYDQSPYTLGDFGHIYSGGCEVHADGEIWAATLWQLRGAYMAVYGPQGRNMLEQDVVDSMKIMPASPSFLNARDAMVQAAINNGEDECLVWQVYAARGMGVDAAVAGNGCVSVTEGFNVPAGCQCVRPQPPTGVTGTPGPGMRVDLSWASQAASGAVAYQILRADGGCGGTLVARGSAQEPSTGFTDTVPAMGAYGYVVRSMTGLGTTCSADSTCIEVVVSCTPGAPDVTPNSVKIAKSGSQASLAWGTSGTGAWNVHETTDQTVLGTIYTDRPSILNTVATPSCPDSLSGSPGVPEFYKVFGADGCSGDSVP